MTAFTIKQLDDKALIRGYLGRDVCRFAYMLGDLDEPYWSNAEFFGAFSPDPTGSPASTLQAIVLRYRPIDPPPVISAGEPEAVGAILKTLHDTYRLHQLVYHAQPDHMAALQTHFQTQDATAMWRMIVSPDRFRDAPNWSSESGESIRRLTAADSESAKQLFSAFPLDEWTFADAAPIAPSAGQLESGAFYGAFEHGELAALAGTHIISSQEKIGAVGYVFTRPTSRGKGYAAGCTAAVTRHLLNRGLTLVALNVKQGNTPAIRAYERIGYVRHSPLYEGHAAPIV